jgi:hypothetical protein
LEKLKYRIKELNPMAKPKATAFDKKRMEMIKELIDCRS